MRRKRPLDFEWTFSSRVRERQCINCDAFTTGFLTLRSGVRKPLCSTCFFSQMTNPPAGFMAKPAARKWPAPAPPREAARSEQLRLC